MCHYNLNVGSEYNMQQKRGLMPWRSVHSVYSGDAEKVLINIVKLKPPIF